VFQEGCFNFSQTKSFVDFFINEFSDAAAKSEILKELSLDWEKFWCDLRELSEQDGKQLVSLTNNE